MSFVRDIRSLLLEFSPFLSLYKTGFFLVSYNFDYIFYHLKTTWSNIIHFF